MLAGGGSERVVGTEQRVEGDRSRRSTFYSLFSAFCSTPPTARITRTSPTRGEVLRALPAERKNERPTVIYLEQTWPLLMFRCSSSTLISIWR